MSRVLEALRESRHAAAAAAPPPAAPRHTIVLRTLAGRSASETPRPTAVLRAALALAMLALAMLVLIYLER